MLNRMNTVRWFSSLFLANVEDAKANTGWDLKVAPQVRTTERATKKELRILRDELDPTGIYLKGAG
jgi:hypothetical protein